jgi:hypothetical protein
LKVQRIRDQEVRTQNKAATFAGRGSVEVADDLKDDLVLSIQSCSHGRLTRSLPKAGIGKVVGLERAVFHPENEVTPAGKPLARD